MTVSGITRGQIWQRWLPALVCAVLTALPAPAAVVSLAYSLAASALPVERSESAPGEDDDQDEAESGKIATSAAAARRRCLLGSAREDSRASSPAQQSVPRSSLLIRISFEHGRRNGTGTPLLC